VVDRFRPGIACRVPDNKLQLPIMYNSFVETVADTPDGKLVSQAQGGDRVLTYWSAVKEQQP
jgi:hypothetical protein